MVDRRGNCTPPARSKFHERTGVPECGHPIRDRPRGYLPVLIEAGSSIRYWHVLPALFAREPWTTRM